MVQQLSWIEQRPSKPWVGGSNPSWITRVQRILCFLESFLCWRDRRTKVSASLRSQRPKLLTYPSWITKYLGFYLMQDPFCVAGMLSLSSPRRYAPRELSLPLFQGIEALRILRRFAPRILSCPRIPPGSPLTKDSMFSRILFILRAFRYDLGRTSMMKQWGYINKY